MSASNLINYNIPVVSHEAKNFLQQSGFHPPDSLCTLRQQSLKVQMTEQRLQQAQECATRDKILSVIRAAAPYLLLAGGIVMALAAPGVSLVGASAIVTGSGLAFAVTTLASDRVTKKIEADDRQVESGSSSYFSLMGAVNSMQRTFNRIPLLQWLHAHRQTNLEEQVSEVISFYKTNRDAINRLMNDDEQTLNSDSIRLEIAEGLRYFSLVNEKG